MDKNSEKVYRFKVPGRKIFSFTAQELYAEFTKESDSERLIPISKVLDICNDKDFPKDYAKQINLDILKSFINSDDSIFDISFQERSALFSCYNSLSNANEIEFNTRQEFLTKFLDDVTEDFILQDPFLASNNYFEACLIYLDWKESVIKDLLKKDIVSFRCLRLKNLFKSFKKALLEKLGQKGFREYIKENKLQQDYFIYLSE